MTDLPQISSGTLVWVEPVSLELTRVGHSSRAFLGESAIKDDREPDIPKEPSQEHLRWQNGGLWAGVCAFSYDNSTVSCVVMRDVGLLNSQCCSSPCSFKVYISIVHK